MAMEGLNDIVKKAVNAARGGDVPDLPDAEDDNFVPSADPDPIEGEGDAVEADEADATEPEETADEPAVEPEVKPEEPAAKKDEPAADPDEDPFAAENGIKSKDKSGRENRIPYSAVKRINTNAIAKAKTAWETEHRTEVQSRDARITHYEDQLKKVGHTEKIMFEDHGTFLGMLIDAIPAYKNLLGDHVERDANGRVTALKASGAPAIDPGDREPEPDVDMGNGQVGYSPEQFKKLRAWDRREAARAAENATRTGIEKEYKPIKDVFELGERKRAEQKQMDDEITTAFKWPGFNENYDAILKAMNEDAAAQNDAIRAGRPAAFKFKNMRDAYDHVMYQKAHGVQETQAQMEARIRKEIQDSLRTAPRSTSAGSSVAAVPAGRGEEPPAASGGTASIVAAAIRRR